MKSFETFADKLERFEQTLHNLRVDWDITMGRLDQFIEDSFVEDWS